MRVKILLLFICISSSAVYGQNAPAYHPIDRSEWEKATEGLSYNEKKQEEEKPKEVTNANILLIMKMVYAGNIKIKNDSM